MGSVLSSRTTLLQENLIFQILFDQKFGKQDLTQVWLEQNGRGNFCGHFQNQQGKYTKIQEFINRTRSVKIIAVNMIFVSRKTERRPIRVPSRTSTRTTSGARTTVEERLIQ